MKRRDPSLQAPKDPGAVEHLEAGKRAFGVQRYDKAAEEYTAAGLTDEAPLILYNLGQTYRAAKEYDKAVRQYTLFLARGKPGPEIEALIECHIATMKAEMEHAASTAPPTEPVSDGTSAGDVQPDEVTPPAEMTRLPESPSDEPVSRWTGKRKLALGMGIAGVLVVGAGALFGVQTKNLKDDAAELCPSNPCASADEANPSVPT